MGEMTSESANAGAGIDLSQFYQVFFEEAGENLERMEQLLLEVDIAAADDEELNSIFRCAHSVKGGAATFGFMDVAELTHQMETLLDKLRRHELAPTTEMVDVLLASGDALRAQLARHQGASSAQVDTTELLFNIRALSAGEALPAPVQAAAVAPAASNEPAATPAAQAAASSARVLELRVGPLDKPEMADNLIELFKEITDLGSIEPIDGGQPSDGMRRFKIATTSSDSDLLDLFTFHVPREAVALMPLGPGYGFHAGNPGAPAEDAPADPGYGFFDDAPGAP
ncbi:Hpt domain-containing protein, partial [Piscinibacter sp.]|uniref:Hpt domain-containing protein n=1 Tax=Piscinibacter sp. TaxID=1903157 RepID=UPI0035B17F07